MTRYYCDFFFCFRLQHHYTSASWSSGNAFVFGAGGFEVRVGGVRFKSLDGQTEYSVANISPPATAKTTVLPTATSKTRRWAFPTSYTIS